MDITKTLSVLKALSNYNSEIEEQIHIDPLSCFSRNFPCTVEAVSINKLTYFVPFGRGYVQNLMLEKSKVVQTFYAPLKSTLFIMDPLEEKYIANNSHGLTSDDSNLYENVENVIDSLSDFF